MLPSFLESSFMLFYFVQGIAKETMEQSSVAGQCTLKRCSSAEQ
jgi:hypothetical protein